MDILTFIAKLAEVLPWPTAIVTIVLVLRKDIQHLLSLLRKLRAGPVEAEFEREVARLAQSAEATQFAPQSVPADIPVPPAARTAYDALQGRQKELINAAEKNPRDAILGAWRDLEAACLHLAERRGLRPLPKRESPMEAMHAIAVAGLIDAGWVSRFHQLHRLRNKAVHDESFNPDLESAAAFIEMTIRLRARLDATSTTRI